MIVASSIRLDLTLQVLTNVLFLGVVAVIYLSAARHKDKRSGDDRIFNAMLISVAAILLVDAVNYYFDGRPGDTVHLILQVSNGVFFALTIIPPVLFIFYTQLNLGIEKPTLRHHIQVLGAVVVVWMGLSLSSPWSGLIFTITASNRYSRGPGFNYLAIVLYSIIAYSLQLIMRHRKALPRHQWISLLLYPLPSIFGAIGQQLFFGTVLLWPGVVISLLILAMNVQNEKIGTDHLTGVNNRMNLIRYLRIKLKGMQSPHLAGIALDLDNFKSINDNQGHIVGDRALMDAASLIRQSIRTNDFLARTGGDEFLILLETDNPEIVREVVDRVRTNFKRFRETQECPYILSTSIGWGIYDSKKDKTPDGFLSRIDAELYKSKTAYIQGNLSF